jgi:membrane-bound lytic murein transglycosylase F
MATRKLKKATPRLSAAAAVMLLAACAQPKSALEQLRARGELRVVALNAPTSYYLGAHGPQGFEYRLASAFAQQLHVRLVVEPVLDAAAMRAALTHGRADMAVGQISADASWRSAGLATDSYDQLSQLVVQARGKARPAGIASLRAARIVVRQGSPQLQLLQSLQRHGMSDLAWTAVPVAQADPLELVSQGNADYAIVDANEFKFAQHLYPDVTAAFTLPDARSVQWVVRSGATDLLDAANSFFADARASGEFASIARDAGAESRGFDYEEAHRFQADIATRLPALQALFERAAAATGLDWRLLAAVGYQESKWQRQAASGDGAEGIMMLTSDAANAVGVTDRADQQQNILGGAQYLAQVIASIPRRISEPDRTWLALAAYNVGYGHLEDARILAQAHGGNPDSWADVRAQLPLLAQEQWYPRLKRGYARGWEPARFVEQVRQYLAVLEWFGTGTVARLHRQPGAALDPLGSYGITRDD